MTAMIEEARTFGGLPVIGQPVSVPSFGAREDVFVALLDALWEAGAKGVAWQAGNRWSVLMSDEEIQGLRSWDLCADDGLDLDGIRRNYGEDSDLADATAAFANAFGHGMFDAVLAVSFGTDSRVLATPEGFEVEPLDTDV